ncbi:DUF559 domain-containing protein [Ectobacillus panaciterrae]|uniref:DUF559 domain-containing protein n=1 Tax=Ectobacillus panaciterrae TaxID=363872 RepID=UPI0003FD073E|nr:DUF559 domain-containing protein [Ectobacillus panaciterrae]
MFAVIILGMAFYGLWYIIRNLQKPNLNHHKDQNRKAEIFRNRAGCSNRFEREMFDALVSLGYTPLTQVKEARYRLDFVLMENGKKVCVEADGEVWHDADHDQKRDKYLLSVGYEAVIRVKYGDWKENKARCIQKLEIRLYELKLLPELHPSYKLQFN